MRVRIALAAMWTAYVLVLGGVATAALTLVNFAGGDAMLGSPAAGATGLLFIGAVVLYYVVKRIENEPALRRDILRNRRAKYLSAHPLTR